MVNLPEAIYDNFMYVVHVVELGTMCALHYHRTALRVRGSGRREHCAAQEYAVGSPCMEFRTIFQVHRSPWAAVIYYLFMKLVNLEINELNGLNRMKMYYFAINGNFAIGLNRMKMYYFAINGNFATHLLPIYY